MVTNKKKQTVSSARGSNKIVKQVQQNIQRSIFSFPYWSSGLIFYSILLVFIKGYLLLTKGFIDVGGVRNTCMWIIGWLGNDILYCMLIWLIGHIAMRVRPLSFKSICVFIMILLLYIYATDIFVLTNFHSRFVLSGIGFFSWENSGPYFWYGLLSTIAWIVGIYFSVYVTYLLAKYSNSRLAFRVLGIGVIVSILVLVGSFFESQASSYQQNVIQLEFSNQDRSKQGQDRPYESYFTSFVGKNKRPNIIVVFAESFSSIDSQYAGGSSNTLPGFDTIARDGTFFTNFIANGCTSDSSQIAMLQGVEPWETTNSQQEYTRYKSYGLSLPAHLSNNGYKTTFISTTPLGFLNQKDFLTSLQFDNIIGNEAFSDWKKYVFRAAPDEALYKQAEKVLAAPRDNPAFITLQTISSHKPYSTPLGDDEESAFKYADQELLDFYHELQAQKYFDNGILIVVGDHRKMQAMGYNEIERWGKSAYGKAVFAMVGKDIPKGEVIEKSVQHWDIFSSLKRLTASGGVQLHEYYNDVFGSYQGRDAAIRYCQFVDRQYVASRPDGSSWTISPKQRNNYASYIRSYYEFQQGKKYNALAVQTGTLTTGAVTFPGLIRIAHQGYTRNSPPNSLDAFKDAKSAGIEGIEMDVSFTRDGYPIVIHGPDIGRTKCTGSIGKKYVSEFDLQEMKDSCELYNDQVILTLQEMLEKTQGMFEWYFIDVKIHSEDQKKYIGPMLKSIQQLGLEDNITFSSTDDTVNYQLASTRGILAGWEIFSLSDLDKVLDSDAHFVLLPESIVNPDVVEKILDTKKIPVTYTVNESSSAKQLYDWGVKYIMTDRPEDIIK